MAQSKQAGWSAGDAGAGKPNAPATPADFVEALEMIVRSKGQQVNAEQLDEVLGDILTTTVPPAAAAAAAAAAAGAGASEAAAAASEAGTPLLHTFTPAQLSLTVKNLAVICEELRVDFIEALVRALQRRLGDLDAQQLAAVGWGLMRLLPVAREDIRSGLGMDAGWLEGYVAAVEQQLQRVLQQQQQQQQQQHEGSLQQQQERPQQKQEGPQQQQQQQQQAWPISRLPSAQQVANLLLLPAAAMVPLQPPLVAVLEEVLLLREASLCGYAVAQLLTCYVRLELRPGDKLLSALLQHMHEELALYDYDELTQVAFNACVLQLDLPDTLLADMTQRAAALEAAGLAAADDKEVLGEALQRLAAARVAVSAAAAQR